MIIIPGWLIAAITFPGVIVHETAHLLFCKWRKVPVLDVCFFQFKNPAGYVIHEAPADFTSAFLISVGPLIVNSLLCVLICFPSSFPLQIYDILNPAGMLFLWLGISIGMHAFPSTQDAKLLWQAARREAGNMNPLAILSFPLVVLIFIANILSVVWFDSLYGIFLGFFLPQWAISKWM